jgi:2-polyprenyl-3-methyl-5-hydroxy-6-metoxy-1,4-benzoquinol methylase
VVPDPTPRDHWEKVWATRAEHDLSWFQAEPSLSVELIEAHAAQGARVLDVGGGASRLVDRLLERGYRVGVLDIAVSALVVTRRRLGARAAEVEWFAVDVTGFSSPHPWEVWHDRAVFHFLTDPAARAAYAEVAARALTSGGIAIVATFAPDGPERCSGLPVVRYGGARLAAELGSRFRLEEERAETHLTPAGREQAFTYAVLRRA